MANKIQFRRGTDGQRGGVTFDSGEPAWTTDTKKLYIGDGTTAGGVEVTGGGGSSTWIGLTDTDPTTFGGQAGKYVKVNAGADGLDFGTPSGSGDMTKCYTPDTDVLTVNGFMPVAGIENGDEICTLNPDTHEIEYQKVSRTFKYQYVGNMYHIDSQQVDLVVTPTHKMFVKKRAYSSPREFELVEARDIFGKRIRYKKDGMWGGEDVDFILPSVEFNGSNGKRCEDAVDIPIVLWAEFMGYYLSEGSCGQYASGGSTIDYKVCITQNQDSPYFDAMLQCASKISNYINRNAFVNGRSIVISSKQLQSYLSQFGKVYDKHVPPEIKNATPATIQKFLEAYVFGDGHISTTCNRVTPKWDIFTTSEQMVDDLQELSLKAGWAANSSVCIEKGYVNTINGRTVVAQADCYRVAINKRKLNPQMNHGHVKPQNGQHEEWVHYDGHVYSVEVPKYHVIYVRRNGKTVWSGNSTYDPNADGIFAIANGGTGQATAQAAMDAISQVAGATNEHVLTKDTGTGNATWKVGGGGGVTNHALLSNLDYASAAHTGFAANPAVTHLDMGGNNITNANAISGQGDSGQTYIVGGSGTHNAQVNTYGKTHAAEAGNIILWVPNAASSALLVAAYIDGKNDAPKFGIAYGIDMNSKKIENLGAGTPGSSDAARMSDITGGGADYTIDGGDATSVYTGTATIDCGAAA